MAANEIQVFRADVEDAEGVAAVHVRAFDATYRDTLPEVAANAPDLEARIESWTALLEPDTEQAYTLVAEQRAQTVGFCSLATPSRDAGGEEKVAEIAALYVAPSRWGNGVGTALITQAITELRDEGWTDVTLWVLEANEPARKFYAQFGFEPDGLTGPDVLTERPKLRLHLKL